jgi:hypothetical protein
VKTATDITVEVRFQGCAPGEDTLASMKASAVDEDKAALLKAVQEDPNASWRK